MWVRIAGSCWLLARGSGRPCLTRNKWKLTQEGTWHLLASTHRQCVHWEKTKSIASKNKKHHRKQLLLSILKGDYSVDMQQCMQKTFTVKKNSCRTNTTVVYFAWKQNQVKMLTGIEGQSVRYNQIQEPRSDKIIRTVFYKDQTDNSI